MTTYQPLITEQMASWNHPGYIGSLPELLHKVSNHVITGLEAGIKLLVIKPNINIVNLVLSLSRSLRLHIHFMAFFTVSSGM